MTTLTNPFLMMSLSARLITLRKERNLTQQQMADTIGIHVNSIKKYESEHAQPSLEVLKKIAISLHVSTDELLFEEHERGPDEELKLQFETVVQLPEEDKKAIRALLEGMIIKHQTKALVSNLSS